MYSQNRLCSGADSLGWLSEPGIENDPYHNAKLESLIRRIKEGTRAVQLKAGLPHEFWPRSIEYFCVAHAVTTPCPVHPNETPEAKKLKEGKTCFEVASGEPFTGYKIPYGALVLYKPPKHRKLPAFDPRTYPGIFCGWRIDNGYKFRGVHLVLDYEAVRTNKKGCEKPIQVCTSELVMPEVFIFHLKKPPMLSCPFSAQKPICQRSSQGTHFRSMRMHQAPSKENVRLM